jgi:hypothetical protein
VRQLNSWLELQGWSTWVDLRDIPPSVDWLADVHRGIEHASTFLFVLSPSSVVSEDCRAELTYAVSLGKRIIPVQVRPVEPSAVPRAAARQQFVVLDSLDDELGLKALALAIRTDLEWRRQHTVLLGKALEWASNGRDESYLLRGTELADADRALEHHREGIEPVPTALQASYVATSRRLTRMLQ